MERPDRLAIGCEPLDGLLGGGIEHGVVTNVYGGAGAGKTNFCMQAVVSCIQNGGSALVIDTEGGFSAERFLQMHDDESALDRVHLSEPTTFEEQQEVFDELQGTVDEHEPELIVVDSLVSLYRLNLNGEPSETNTELSRQFSILSKLAREEHLPVIVTNQVYSKFDTDELELVGRDVPAYWSKVLMELEKHDAHTRNAILRKHRSRPEGLQAKFRITSDALTGVDGEQEQKMKIF